MATTNSISSKSSSKLFATPLRLSLPLFRSKSKSSSSPTSTLPPWPRNSSSKEDQLEQVFRFFDENKDGKISVEELRAYFTSVGDSLSREEAERVISEFDEDGDNLLGFQDFVRLMEEQDRDGDGEEYDCVRKAFEMFEVDKGCGCITPKGLQRVLKRLGNARSFEECKAMIGVYDVDGNGVLDFNEFRRMMS